MNATSSFHKKSQPNRISEKSLKPKSSHPVQNRDSYGRFCSKSKSESADPKKQIQKKSKKSDDSKKQIQKKLKKSADSKKQIQKKLKKSSDSKNQIQKKLKKSADSKKQIQKKLKKSADSKKQVQKKLKKSADSKKQIQKKLKKSADSKKQIQKKLKKSADSKKQVQKKLKKSADSNKQIQKTLKINQKNDNAEVIALAMEKHYRKEELKPYQAELIKMQRHIEECNKKVVILFDGRDASGKGGTIRRITRYMNEKRYRTVALGKPTQQQKTELHIKRYIEHFPYAGEIVLFDRSWYNRALVEPVMGFCTKAQYKRFLKKVIFYEQNFLEDDGKTILIKLYFSVSKEEQKRRFDRRKNDPLRQWKLSEVDLQAQELWDEFTEKKFTLLKRTHTKKSPWWVIRSDDKHLARKETMKLILNVVRYKGRSRKLDFSLDPSIVITGKKELKEMKGQRKEYGKLMV